MPTAAFAAEREAMVERQLRRRGIGDKAILDAFRAVPREEFVGRDLAHLAYADHPLAIGFGQTISQPYIVALMIAAARIGADDRVLEVGSGSGYAAAVIGRLAARVVGVERQPALAAQARARLERLGLDHAEIVTGDGTGGWPAGAPYDAILVSAAAASVPAPLIDQLAEGGRLVVPIGPSGAVQQLVVLARDRDGSLSRSVLGAVRFVPLIAAES